MLLLSQAPATLAPKLARHGWLHSIFLWDRPLLLSRPKYLKVPLTLEGTLQAATAVTRCDCSADSTYKGAAFQFLLLLLAFQVVCLPVCCTQFPFSLPLSSSIYQEERQPPNPHSWVWNSLRTHYAHTLNGYWMKAPLAMHIHVFCVDIKPQHVTSPCVRLNECLDVRATSCPRLPAELRQQ